MRGRFRLATPRIDATSILRLLKVLSFLSSSARCPEFLTTVKDSFPEYLQRLNQLPRTDAFRRNANLRPTVPKLAEFCQRVLQKSDDSV